MRFFLLYCMYLLYVILKKCVSLFKLQEMLCLAKRALSGITSLEGVVGV